MRAKRMNEDVLVADERMVTVSREDVERLKAGARQNARQRIRFCAHQDVNDAVHEMLIVHLQGAYVRPHKHLRKTESFHVIEGLGDVVIFDEAGHITDVIRVGEYASGERFYYRMAEARYHTILIRSEVLVFHETANGPFRRSDAAFAPWAPEEMDAAAGEFMQRLEQSIARFQRSVQVQPPA